MSLMHKYLTQDICDPDVNADLNLNETPLSRGISRNHMFLHESDFSGFPVESIKMHAKTTQDLD